MAYSRNKKGSSFYAEGLKLVIFVLTSLAGSGGVGLLTGDRAAQEVNVRVAVLQNDVQALSKELQMYRNTLPDSIELIAMKTVLKLVKPESIQQVK